MGGPKGLLPWKTEVKNDVYDALDWLGKDMQELRLALWILQEHGLFFFPFYQDFSINNTNKWPWCKETHFLLIEQGFIANGRQLVWITPKLILESQMRLKFGLGTLSFFLSHLFHLTLMPVHSFVVYCIKRSALCQL